MIKFLYFCFYSGFEFVCFNADMCFVINECGIDVWEEKKEEWERER